MTGFIEGVRAGFEDAVFAWRSASRAALSGARLAALPLLAMPVVAAAAFGAGLNPHEGLFLILLPSAVGCLLLSYGAHLHAQGLVAPSIFGVYRRPFFWTFAAAAIVTFVLQTVPMAAALLLLAAAMMDAIPQGQTLAYVFVFAGSLVATFWLYARLALAMPASAATGRLAIPAAWNASHGRVARILAATFAVILPIELLDTVVRIAFGEAVGTILSVPAMLLQVVVVSVALSSVWMATRGTVPVGA